MLSEKPFVSLLVYFEEEIIDNLLCTCGTGYKSALIEEKGGGGIMNDESVVYSCAKYYTREYYVRMNELWSGGYEKLP